MACMPLVGYPAAGECCSAEDMIKCAPSLQLIERCLHTIAVRRVDRGATCEPAGFFRARARVGGGRQNEGKYSSVPDSATTSGRRRGNFTPSTRNRHKLLSQRPGRLDRLLKVPEEERRVGPRDDAVVARQCDHHSFFDAHTRQRFRQVDDLRFRRRDR